MSTYSYVLGNGISFNRGVQLIGLYRNHRFHAVHTDHLGTPRLITDDDNKPVWQWSYSAFGDNQPTGTDPKSPLYNKANWSKPGNWNCFGTCSVKR